MFLIGMFLLGCNSNEAILTGVPEEPLLGDEASDREIRQNRKQTPKKIKEYQKKDNVLVDIHHLSGKTFSAVQGQLQEQLGPLYSTHPLPRKDGERRVYEKGEIRMEDDQIYMIKFELPYPMRRAEALSKAGFPSQVDKYISTHKEYQLTNEWGFRRVRMKRQSKTSELVTYFEAWKWVPNERVRH